MNNLIVACTNLRNEIDMIIEEINERVNIIYVDSKYHNNPEKLHRELQNIIDENSGYENIVFLYGQCGNAAIGLQSQYSRIIFLRVSDCISLYLGGNEKRASLYKSERSYYFTKAYLENDNSMYNEIQIMKEKYGENK